MSRRTGSNGFSVPIILIILVMVVLIISAIVFLNHNQDTFKPSLNHHNATSKAGSANGVNQDRLTTTSFAIPELNLRIAIPEPLKDLKYKIEVLKNDSGETINVAYFSTQKLEDEDKDCSVDNGPLGAIQVQSGMYDKQYGSLVKQFDNQYVTYQSPHGSCTQSEDTSGTNTYNQSLESFRTATETIQVLK